MRELAGGMFVISGLFLVKKQAPGPKCNMIILNILIEAVTPYSNPSPPMLILGTVRLNPLAYSRE